MLSEKNIVVTIGNYGAVVALHEGSGVRNKIFLDDLNDSSKEELKKLFIQNKSAAVSVLLDTVDQSYKKKIYPAARKADLVRIAKRDLAGDGDKESLKNFIIFNPKKTTKANKINRWECLFISSSSSDVIDKWIEFLLDLPNRLTGIYMLPVESFSLFKLLKNNIKSRSKVHQKNNDLYCFIVQNKVSGIRQIVFSDQGIVFTRVVNYDFSQDDFLEKYEQDIYSTFEYLKRLYPDLKIAELDIVNIFPNEVLEKIKSIENLELSLTNYTPNQAAVDAGYGKIMPQSSNFCDLLISKAFAKSKKILKFSTPKIAALDRFFVMLRASYYVNIAMILAICVTFVSTIFFQDQYGEEIQLAENEKAAALDELNKARKTVLEGAQGTEDGEGISLERITDIGKMEEVLGSSQFDFIEIYSSLGFLREFNAKLTSFNASLNGFNTKFPSQSQGYKITFGGNLTNKSGNIEDLFSEFDALVAQTKANFNKNEISYKEPPRNIDFNAKYYEFPIEFVVNKK